MRERCSKKEEEEGLNFQKLDEGGYFDGGMDEIWSVMGAVKEDMASKME